MSTLTASAQPLRALRKANSHRSRAAAIKHQLRNGQVTIAALLADPPTELHRHLTWEVLLWTPGVGHQRLRTLNSRALRAGHVNLAAPLGALTPRQRVWLADQLQQR